MNCSNAQYLSNLIETNRKARVDPEIIDLLAAYSRICLQNGNEPVFYKDDPVLSTNKTTIKKFIEKNPHLDKRSLSFLASYAEIMRGKRLPFIFNRAHLAAFLEIPENELKTFVEEKERYYASFYILKSNGGKRLITAPSEPLKLVQKVVLRSILERVPVHSSVHGFRRGRSIISNSGNHTGREIVVKMDIKDFFPSITAARVKGVYINLGYPEGVADALTELTTHKGRLPMGAPTSPYLSNIVAFRMDVRFTNLGKKMDFIYTRYADDLAFSSQQKNFARNMVFFKKIIEDEGFEVNEEKVNIVRKGGRQKITGVVVNKKVNADKREYKKLRAVVHNCLNGDPTEEMKKWGVSEMQQFKNILSGHINFVRMVNGDRGDKLIEAFRRISWPV